MVATLRQILQIIDNKHFHTENYSTNKNKIENFMSSKLDFLFLLWYISREYTHKHTFSVGSINEERKKKKIDANIFFKRIASRVWIRQRTGKKKCVYESVFLWRI